MKGRLVGLLVALTVGASGALVVVPPVTAEIGCTTNCASGSSNPYGVAISADGSMAFPGTPYVGPPSNPPGSTPTPQCAGYGWDYYGLGLRNLTKQAMSGVNAKMTNGLALVGGSPSGSNFNYSRSPYDTLHTYPSSISPAQNWYAAWQGTWSPTYSTKTETVTTTSTTPGHWVKTGRQDVWVPGTTRIVKTQKTVKTVIGCNLGNFASSTAYFYSVTPCIAPSCLAKQLPPLLPLVQGLAETLSKGWTPGDVVSSPPAGFITVWVPTQFSLSGGTMPPVGGTTASKQRTVNITLNGSPRVLTIALSVTIQPVAVDWTYTASGGQSGRGFTCTFRTDPYTSTGGENRPSCTSINAGYPSANGYIFTHDALHLTVSAKVYLALSASASWTVNNKTHTESIPLGGLGSTVAVAQKPEHSTIQQVEGITQP